MQSEDKMTQPDQRPAVVDHNQSDSVRHQRRTRLSQLLLLALLLSTPFVVRAAVASWQNNNNDVISWADEDLPIRRQFQTFVEHFGRPELIVVSWPGCRTESPELAALAATIENESDDWFVNVTTTQSVLQELSDVPAGPPESEIRRQLKGILVGPDEVQACLIVELGPTGRDQRPDALQRLKTFATDVGLSPEEVRIGGMGAELAWLDDESVAAPARTAPVIGVLITILCMCFLRSVRLGLFVSLLGGYTAVLSAAIVYWCGVQSNAVLATLPTLGGLLAISLSLHFAGYYRNAAGQTTNPRDALNQALKWAWKPTLISATTTALGLGSLILSRTGTIQTFGTFGAATTICAAILTLTVLPAFFSLMGSRLLRSANSAQHRFWTRWISLIEFRPGLIVVIVAAVALVMATGLTQLRTGVHINSLFTEDHEIIQDDDWLEEHIGPLATLEVMVTFPHGKSKTEQSSPEQHPATNLIHVQALTAHLRSTEKFGAFVSAATGLPDLNEQRGLARMTATARLRKWMNEHHDELLSSGLYAETDTAQLWRISLRISTLTAEPTNELRKQLEAHIDSFLATYTADNEKLANSMTYMVTGLPLLFEQIEQQFIEDLMITYGGGLILISLTVFLVLRNFADAVTAMIPNVLPAIGVLGCLSLLGVELDVGSVMTASIALGVAVDDTLHFILWYQQQRSSECSPKDSLRSAILHCGAPILQTSIICGTGLATLGMASFLPTARFGILIALMLCVALVGDLLFLPAMLAMRGKKA